MSGSLEAPARSRDQQGDRSVGRMEKMGGAWESEEQLQGTVGKQNPSRRLEKKKGGK